MSHISNVSKHGTLFANGITSHFACNYLCSQIKGMTTKTPDSAYAPFTENNEAQQQRSTCMLGGRAVREWFQYSLTESEIQILFFLCV